MDRKIRIGAVSYLNSKPLIHGFPGHRLMDRATLMADYPSKVAEYLQNGKIDVGLVPVAIIPHLPQAHLVSDYCISCQGAVASVAIFGDTPIQQMTTVWMDYQSKTSVALAKILLRDYWGVMPELRYASNDAYLDEIKGDVGGLVIGDRAFAQRHRSPYVYDLGEVWYALTNLPFVFATWVATEKLDDAFIADFNHANSIGLDDLNNVIGQLPETGYSLKKYFTENIHYHFGEEQKKGLQRFLALAQT